MSPHKVIYFKHFGYTEGDYIACEMCCKQAVDVHAIQADGSGGRPSKSTHIIENLMAVCRKCHEDWGGNTDMYFHMYEKHRQTLVQHGVKFDEELIQQLKRGKRL